ncbi:rhomboid family intramembrane serine protease [bacterium CPR1]|nr:rhomboid family intramembrane serine protease [bacterium CPR1]
MEATGRLSRPWATYGLAGVLVAVFLADLASHGWLLHHGKRDVVIFFLKPEPHRMLTSIFLHGNWLHLVMNTLALVTLGVLIEELVGWWMLLLVFVYGGVAGNLVSAEFGPESRGVGASGGLAGLFGLLVMLMARRVYRASREQALMMLVVFLLAVGMAFQPLPIDNYAHLGGFLAGLLLGAFARRGGLHPAGWAVAGAALAWLWWRLSIP